MENNKYNTIKLKIYIAFGVLDILFFIANIKFGTVFNSIGQSQYAFACIAATVGCLIVSLFVEF